MSLRTRIVGAINAINYDALGTSTGARTYRVEQTRVVQLEQGILADQASLVFREEFTLAADAQQSWNLLALADENGDALAFTKVKGFLLEISPSAAAAARLGVSGTFNPLSDGDDSSSVALAPGDFYLVHRALGIAVGADNKTLTVEASGGTVTATLTLIGI